MSGATATHRTEGSERFYMLAAALAHAGDGYPVFPCRPGGKKPITEKGFHDAVTDEDQIRRWWHRSPKANIGIPTGPPSGVLVIDVDRDRFGFGSLEELEARYGKLPPTRTVRTGGGGVHHYFRYPAGEPITSRTDKFELPGVDVRAAGGYVIAPPGRTEGPYEVLEDLPLADLPAAWSEALRMDSRASDSTATGATAPTGVDLAGDPILEGRRNVTLTSIAGRLRARGYGGTEIRDALLQANASRCEPVLPESEVLGIARSALRWAPGTSSPGPTSEVLDALAGIEDALLRRREWSGMGGKSERDVVVALVKLARQHGTKIPAGVRVPISVRALALAAALSKKATEGAVKRLKSAGVIRSDNAERSGTKAGAFVLLEHRAKVGHSTTTEGLREGESTSVLPLRAPRLRWSAPEIQRLGKTCGAVLDHLEDAGGTMTIDQLADALHVARPRDLRRRVVARLEEAGVVECSGNTVRLTADWLESLNRDRDRAGEIDAYRRDMQRYARERTAYANRNRTKPGRSPSREDMDARCRERNRRDAAGATDELEKLPPPAPPVELYPYLGKPVLTRRGRGKLWQAFSDRIGVVLDDAPGAVAFMDPAELVGVVESPAA